MTKIRMIAAIDDKRGLARGRHIPWKLPSDTKYYQDKTEGQPIVLGKNTFEIMGAETLASRYLHVYVLSNEPLAVPNGEVVDDVAKLVNELSEDLWVLGSGGVYQQFLPYADELYLTRVNGNFGCDIFFPEFEHAFTLKNKSEEKQENGIQFRFETWIPTNPK